MKIKKIAIKILATMIGIGLFEQPVIAMAETVAYSTTLEEATYDLAVSTRYSENYLEVNYNTACSNVDDTVRNILHTVYRVDMGKVKYRDYYLLSLASISWDTPVYDQYNDTYCIGLELEYTETAEQTAKAIKQVNMIVKENQKELEKSTDSEKYRWIYDYLIDNFEYDDSKVNDAGYEALVSNTTTCRGYAGLYYLFARAMGLECRIAMGTVEGIGHAWNVVKLDGKWYYVDATWGEDCYINYLFRAKDNLTTHQLSDEETFKGLKFAKEDYEYTWYTISY